MIFRIYNPSFMFAFEFEGKNEFLSVNGRNALILNSHFVTHSRWYFNLSEFVVWLLKIGKYSEIIIIIISIMDLTQANTSSEVVFIDVCVQPITVEIIDPLH